MALLAAKLSGYVNAVSEEHCEVSKKLFPSDVEIDFITNGINVNLWVSPYLREVYNHAFPTGWTQRPKNLKNIFHYKYYLCKTGKNLKKKIRYFINQY